MQGVPSDPIKNEDRKRKIGEFNKGRTKSLDHRNKISVSLLGTHPTESTRIKMRLVNSGENNPHYGKHHSDETRKAISLSNQSYENHVKRAESRVGGFWYGAVTYRKPQRYCELWTDDLRDRIRSYWDNKSVLSGKTRYENNGRNLSCHHVYYQKKACCTWDEDVQGYYAMIDGEKYYIKGDPNKFVTLTSSEHATVAFNKLYWVKLFEDLIEEQGGQCYISKGD